MFERTCNYFIRLSVFFVLVILHTKIRTYELEKPIYFLIDICSYNNKEWLEYNLGSVIAQDYPYYRVIYSNDCSKDDTGKLAQQYVRDNGQQDRFIFIDNTVRVRQLANHYRVIHMAKENEVIIHLDGDDWFFDAHVLSRLAKVYQDSNVWMTLGSHCRWAGAEQYDHIYKKLPDVMIQSGSFREKLKGSYHLRSYYAFLAKQVKLKDLIYPYAPFEGKFFPAVSDWSLMFPMLEMVAGRSKIIQDILYVYNVVNPINNFKIERKLQRSCKKYLCSQIKYEQYETVQAARYKANQQVSVDVVIMMDSGENLTNDIVNSLKNIDNIGSINVVYPAAKGQISVESKKIISGVNFIQAGNDYGYSFEQCLRGLKSDYVLCATNGVKIEQSIDLKWCIAQLEKTQAYGFYFVVGAHNSKEPLPYQTLQEDGLCCWKFKLASKLNFGPHKIGMTLYRKIDLIDSIACIKESAFNEFKKTWQAYHSDSDEVGLFYEQPKVVLV